MPTHFTGGFRGGNRAGLIHDTYIEAFKIVKDKQNFKSYILSEEMLNKVDEVKRKYGTEQELFNKMS